MLGSRASPVILAQLSMDTLNVWIVCVKLSKERLLSPKGSNNLPIGFILEYGCLEIQPKLMETVDFCSPSDYN